MKRLVLTIYAFLLSLFRKKDEYVFVVSHMRSGSTLLSHLLMSNGEICGVGESNRVYHSDRDLLMLTLKSRLRFLTRFFSSRYFLDQVNHNHMLPDLNVLHSNRTKMIFLCREPHHSLASIVQLSKDFYLGSWDQKKADDYYVARLEHLKKIWMSQSDSTNCLLLTYNELINDSDQCLKQLQEFLGLGSPLKASYQKFSFTGKSGDPSESIQSGKIVRGNSKNIHKDSASENAWKAYEDFIKLRK